VTVDHGNRTATPELTAGGTLGDFQMPDEGNAVEVRGMPESHGLRNFTIVLIPDDQDAATFNTLQWPLRVEGGNPEFEIHLRKNGMDNDPTTPCNERRVSLSGYDSETNGNKYHGWQNPTAFRTECGDSPGPGSNDRTRLVATLSDTIALETADLNSGDPEYYNPGDATRRSNVTVDEHAGGVAWVSRTFNDAADDTIHEDASRGTIEYDAEGQVTFVHVTENRLRAGVTA
jgi:hypothetical protein